LITRVDVQLRQQAERFAFRFGCEACFAFDPVSRRCAHGFPNEEHLGVDLSKVERVIFCKEFEVT
jgi:hypothetical protein